jgi:imidazolonepropionase-like amidohydrolase
MPGSPASEAASPPVLAVVGVAVFDGGGGPPVPDRTVVAAGGLIQRIGPATATGPPGGAVVVDGTGATLLPGFVDAHVHLDFYPPAQVLAGGVTTVRDLGWPAGRLAALSARAAAPGAASPRLLAAGQIVTVPGGYPTRARWAPPGTARPVDGAAEAVAAVAELAETGAAVIKVALDDRVGPTLPAPVLAAIVRAAGERGLGVTAHVGTAAEAAKALAAGVGELAHWPFDPSPSARPPGRRPGRVGGWPCLPSTSTPARPGGAGVRRFVGRGGRVVYWTDLGNQGPPAGRSTPRSCACWSRAGLDRARPWPPPTSLAADHLGVAGLGRVAPGATADLLLVDGRPAGPTSMPCPGCGWLPATAGSRVIRAARDDAPAGPPDALLLRDRVIRVLTQALRQAPITHFPGCFGKYLATGCCEPVIPVVIFEKSASVGGNRMR